MYAIPLPDAETCRSVATLLRAEVADLRAPGVFECRPTDGGTALEPCLRQEWEMP